MSLAEGTPDRCVGCRVDSIRDNSDRQGSLRPLRQIRRAYLLLLQIAWVKSVTVSLSENLKEAVRALMQRENKYEKN